MSTIVLPNWRWLTDFFVIIITISANRRSTQALTDFIDSPATYSVAAFRTSAGWSWLSFTERVRLARPCFGSTGSGGACCYRKCFLDFIIMIVFIDFVKDDPKDSIINQPFLSIYVYFEFATQLHQRKHRLFGIFQPLGPSRRSLVQPQHLR